MTTWRWWFLNIFFFKWHNDIGWVTIALLRALLCWSQNSADENSLLCHIFSFFETHSTSNWCFARTGHFRLTWLVQTHCGPIRVWVFCCCFRIAPVREKRNCWHSRSLLWGFTESHSHFLPLWRRLEHWPGTAPAGQQFVAEKHAPPLKKSAASDFGTWNIAAKRFDDNAGLFEHKWAAPEHFSCNPQAHHVSSEAFLLQPESRIWMQNLFRCCNCWCICFLEAPSGLLPAPTGTAAMPNWFLCSSASYQVQYQVPGTVHWTVDLPGLIGYRPNSLMHARHQTCLCQELRVPVWIFVIVPMAGRNTYRIGQLDVDTNCRVNVLLWRSQAADPAPRREASD